MTQEEQTNPDGKDKMEIDDDEENNSENKAGDNKAGDSDEKISTIKSCPKEKKKTKQRKRCRKIPTTTKKTQSRMMMNL